MSIKVAYRDGVFEPLEKVEGAQPGAIYTAFSEDEMRQASVSNASSIWRSRSSSLRRGERSSSAA